MKLAVIEGNTLWFDGGASFGNASKVVWSRWIEADDQNRIKLATRALFVEFDDGYKVLFEAGAGNFLDPELRQRFGVQEDDHRLLENLSSQGVAHEDIDAIVLSHLHFDHAGGLLASWKEGKEHRLLFPNARFIVSETHWQRALSPHPRDRASFVAELHELLQQSGRLELVGQDQTEILEGRVKVRFSDGHTPGLMLSEINTPKGPMVYASDLVPGPAWVHIPITMGYDRFPEKVIDEKTVLLEDLYRRNGLLYFTHDPRMPCGRISRDDRGRFSVQAVQL